MSISCSLSWPAGSGFAFGSFVSFALISFVSLVSFVSLISLGFFDAFSDPAAFGEGAGVRC